MNQSSDSESEDSDRGIRYKTDCIRNLQESPLSIEKNKLTQIKDAAEKQQTIIGPELPPHLKKNSSHDKIEIKCKVLGPELPLHLQKNKTECKEIIEINVGPALPLNSDYENEEDSIKSTLVMGPSLPSHSQTFPESTNAIIMPALPPHLQKLNNIDQFQMNSEISNQNCIGPVLPQHMRQKLLQAAESQSSDDEDIYGPVPAGFSTSKAHIELEERALQIKIDLLNPQEQKEPVREEWMLELPAAKASSFGLGPRQFRTKEAPDLSNRSSWTDTPEDRAKKKEKKEKDEVDPKKDVELREIKKRDKEQEAIVKKCKRSQESLVEMHTKNLKKKKESEPSERRPFSREIDLEVNRFDEARKKAVLKKAQLLDSRFSAGKSKFL